MISPPWLSKNFPESVRIVDSQRIGAQVAHEWLEQRLKDEDKRRGRPRQLKVRTLLIGLQLMAMDGEFLLDDLPTLLDMLSPRARASLGLPRTCSTITKRKVYYLVERIDSVLRKGLTAENRRTMEPYKDFDQFFNALATAGAYEGDASLSISIDGSDIASWGKQPHHVWKPVMSDLGPL
jgi:hypothetical protein